MVKALARKAGDLWFDSRLWHVLIFSIFLRILKIVSVCTEKRRNPGCSLAVDYIYIYIYIYTPQNKVFQCVIHNL